LSVASLPALCAGAAFTAVSGLPGRWRPPPPLPRARPCPAGRPRQRLLFGGAGGRPPGRCRAPRPGCRWRSPMPARAAAAACLASVAGRVAAAVAEIVVGLVVVASGGWQRRRGSSPTARRYPSRRCRWILGRWPLRLPPGARRTSAAWWARWRGRGWAVTAATAAASPAAATMVGGARPAAAARRLVDTPAVAVPPATMGTYGADDDENDGRRSVDAAPAAADAVSVVRIARAGGWPAWRELGLSLSALDVQNALRGSRRHRVVSISDQRLRLVTLELPSRVLVDCMTAFVGAVEMSPHVFHYWYLRNLLSLYSVAPNPAWGGGERAAASVAMAALTPDVAGGAAAGGMAPRRGQRRCPLAGPRRHRRCWRGRRPPTAPPAAARARRGTPAPWRFGGSSSSRGWIPKRPPCPANSQCALACHAAARAHALIATVAASGSRQRASSRSARSAGAFPASRREQSHPSAHVDTCPRVPHSLNGRRHTHNRAGATLTPATTLFARGE